MKNGVHPAQIKAKKKALGSLDITETLPGANGANTLVTPTSDKIPENGTKTISMEKAEFANSNYTIAPAYSKGAYQVISKEDVKTAGKKV